MSKDIRTRYIDDPLRGDLKDFEGIVVLRWEKGFTPARNGICPWLVTGSGLALIPLFFENKAEAVEWLQNPTKVFVFNGFRLAVVWAKSSLDAQKDFELRVQPGLQSSKTREEKKVARAAEVGRIPLEGRDGEEKFFLIDPRDADLVLRKWREDGDYARECGVGGRRAHTLILERVLGRSLEEGELAHHENEDPLDNRRENLVLHDKSSHAKVHNLGKNG